MFWIMLSSALRLHEVIGDCLNVNVRSIFCLSLYLKDLLECMLVHYQKIRQVLSWMMSLAAIIFSMNNLKNFYLLALYHRVYFYSGKYCALSWFRFREFKIFLIHKTLRYPDWFFQILIKTWLLVWYFIWYHEHCDWYQLEVKMIIFKSFWFIPNL